MRLFKAFLSIAFASIAIAASAARYGRELLVRIAEFIVHPAGAARFHIDQERIVLSDRGAPLSGALVQSLRHEAGQKRRSAARYT